MFYALAAIGGAVGGFFLGRLPLMAKLKQIETIVANELHGATVGTQSVLQRIAKAL